MKNCWLLAIATNVHVLLVTGFVIEGHICLFSLILLLKYILYFIIILFFNYFILPIRQVKWL